MSLFLWTTASCGTTQGTPQTTTAEEQTVQDVEWTQVSSGSDGQGRDTPYATVSDSSESLEGTGVETTSRPPQDAKILTIHRGEQRSSGYTVEVDSVRRDAGEIVVTLELRDPPEGAIVAQVITYPYTVVALQGVQTDEDFVFEDTSGRRLDWPVEK